LIQDDLKKIPKSSNIYIYPVKYSALNENPVVNNNKLS
jgi:hypothetical protein